MLAHASLVLRENVCSGWVGCHQCQDKEKVVESAEVYCVLADFLPAGLAVMEKGILKPPGIIVICVFLIDALSILATSTSSLKLCYFIHRH